MFPIMTGELSRRLQGVEAACFESWAAHLQSLPRNPFGVHINRVGGALALTNQDMTLGPLFNRVLAFGDETLPLLDSLIALYGKCRAPLRIDLDPFQASPALTKTLSAASMRPVRYHSVIYGPGAPAKFVDEEFEKIRVRVTMVGTAEAPAWARLWRDAFAPTASINAGVVNDVAISASTLHKLPGWNLYIVTFDDVPAGAGALFLHDGVGFLGLAAVSPQFRRQGCHTALITQRLADAFQNNCMLVAAVTELDSTAQHNLERADLRIAGTRGYWVRFPTA